MININHKTFLRLSMTISFCVLSAVAVFSQQATPTTESSNPDDITEIADQALKIQITPLIQQYPSKNIGFKLTIKSEVDSGRVVIQWYYPQSLFQVIGDAKDNVTIIANNEFSEEKYFSPIIIKNEKTFTRALTIGVKVSALTFEKNYLTIVKSNFIIDSEFQLIPITDEYRASKTDYEVTIIVRNLLITGVIMLVVSFGLGKFVDYLNSDDRPKS